ncbi:GyrI-like domain-containing protein [Legionella waltersii]|uniref:Transcription activator n=1 Tax=Legionella waltersii TaxID=66969 RepID=A0A0W1A5B8_9GAMM|nr:GyrI-like domain-containing protein [Legionella waltersii]KTD76562.1 Transcription activator [Legionella waltersii]SNU94148.1 Transcription activator, effector binding [Legionella waltersii]
MSVINPVLKHVDSFTVKGLTVRTKNSDEFNPEIAKLPTLWQRFYASNLIPNTTIFGVYSGYETDANGPYDVTAGTINSNQGAELSAVKINSGNYLVFQGKGAMPQTVIETWKRVWDYFTADSPYQRCFMTDFEEYKNGDEVAIFIGVR